MAILPSKTADMIQWCNVRKSVWADNADSLGLTAGQTTTFTTLSTAAQSALAAQQAALQAYRDATVMLRAASRDLRRNAGDTLAVIKAFAQNAPKPAEVYTIAQIPPPAQPGTLPPPGIPFDFRASLNPGGSLTLRWKCNNPAGASGTIYSVRRRIGTGGSMGPWTHVGASGLRKFIDETFAGNPVQYQIQAQRGTSLGLVSSTFTVQFGSGSDSFGGLSISAQFEEPKSAGEKNAA